MTASIIARFLLLAVWALTRLLLPPHRPISRMTDEVRRRKEQRLEALRETAASYGLDVPPHVATEIEDLEDELATVDLLTQERRDQPTRELIDRSDPRELILRVRTDLSRRIRSIEESMRADAEQRHLDRSRGSLIIGIMAAVLVLVLILVVILLIVALN